MKISVFGLGYVGAVSVGCLARDGHDVVGVDIDETKLDLIRDGRSPVIEEGIQELIAEGVSAGRISVTSGTREAIEGTDVSFICVGTPPLPNGGQDLGAVTGLSAQIGEALARKDGFHVLVMRSTVLPGTVEQSLKPIIEERSGKAAGRDFGLCFQPEFLREGSSIKDYYNPPYTVVGASDERSVAAVREIFGQLPGEFFSTTIPTAEMVKYCCNAFHALKVTFANEIGRVCQRIGVDSHAVMDLVCQDRKLNISRAYLRPGFAFGGSCLPKDLKALVQLAVHSDIKVPVLEHILPSNTIHVEHAVDTVIASGKRSIGMIGLSFKSGTDDLRESPLVIMAERFIGKGFDLKIYDPEVNVSRLIGANRRFINETIPHIASLMDDDCTKVIEESDVVVVGLQDEEPISALKSLLRPDQIVLDLIGIPDRGAIKAEYHGVCW